VRESLRRDEADRIPSLIADVGDIQGLDITRVQHIVMIRALFAVRVIREVKWSGALCKRPVNGFKNPLVGRQPQSPRVKNGCAGCS
jgi:hypothetical protein